MMNLPAINALAQSEARDVFLRCCGSLRWAHAMADRRPFASLQDLLAAAADIERTLSRADWLEAFAAHPRIGDIDSLRKKFAGTADWCSSEQAGVAGAADEILHALAAGNRDYEDRFGIIFIVCATGKTAAEMLALLRARLGNDPETEWAIAIAEQAKITRLRLEKL